MITPGKLFKVEPRFSYRSGAHRYYKIEPGEVVMILSCMLGYESEREVYEQSLLLPNGDVCSYLITANTFAELFTPL